MRTEEKGKWMRTSMLAEKHNKKITKIYVLGNLKNRNLMGTRYPPSNQVPIPAYYAYYYLCWAT